MTSGASQRRRANSPPLRIADALMTAADLLFGAILAMGYLAAALGLDRQ